MKLFIGCLFCGLLCVVLADAKVNDDSKTETNGKSNGSKPKRDASLLSSVYHGPSYKYLPPSTISSTYDSYPGKVGSYAGYSGGHTSGIGGVFRTGVSGHGHRHHGYTSSDNRNIGVFHSLDNEPILHHSNGHHGYIFPNVNYNVGQGSTPFVRGGYKGVTSSHIGAKLGPTDFSAGRPHTFAFGNGNSLGSNTASVGSYQYNKGFGSSYTPVSTGFQTSDGFASSAGLVSHEEHHGDHVHNGAQEHVYVVSNIPAGLGNGYESKKTPVHQHPLPSASGTSFDTKYYSQTTDHHGPVYAAGHKGLGHFGFTANKPQVVHATLSGPSFQQPSYSKVPFKPSTFLGAKFEGSTSGDFHPQQYLPPLEEATGATGYDYPIPTETYQEPNHHQTAEVQASSLLEQDSAYLPPKSNPDSGYDLSSAANSKYLPPTDSYGNTYSH